MPKDLIHIRSSRRYGWVPDLPDARDHLYAVSRAVMEVLPVRADLQALCPSVYDQGELGSCTANAIAAAIQFERMKQQVKDSAVVPGATPSRLFIYYNERAMEGTVGEDAGAQIRDGIKAVARLGVCFEGGPFAWPYDIAKFACQPPKADYTEALRNQVVQYSRLIPSLAQLKGCIAAGYPFIFGFTVYDSFEGAAVEKSGIVPMPGRGDTVVGGHAVLAVGYDDMMQRFKVRNSWGPKWGQRGYCWMPYAYLTDSNLADDFWTIRLVEAS
jgi:C1A family cysteine protease